MGVEYCHYLIPRPNSFYPSAEQLTQFVESLANDKWIAVPASDALRQMAAIDGLSFADADGAWANIWLPRGWASVPYPLTSAWFHERQSDNLKLGFFVEHADAVDLRYPLVSDSGLPDDPYYEIQLQS